MKALSLMSLGMIIFSFSVSGQDHSSEETCKAYTFVVPQGQSCNCESLQTTVEGLQARVRSLETVIENSASVNGQASTFSYVPIYKDCQELMTDRSRKHESGIYLVQPQNAPKPFHVWCEIDIHGATTVIQRRKDGSVSFFRDWDEYKRGFGTLDGEFWLGNEQIYYLTNQGDYQLYIEMQDWEGNAAYAKYDNFEISDESDNYRLEVDGFQGDAGDSLTYHDGQQFSTKGKDNDMSLHEDCAAVHRAAWWYNTCHWSNLNGVYVTGGRYSYSTYAFGIEWRTFKNGYGYSMKRTTMKIKPKFEVIPE
ncbi:microfibril-associated glycoprotein 4-like [Ptychodera flava]|uniref:microfibril-associated glycoprotein 4-like n=1 Tax=Ptychodera flava TaxID=63121 RepID=UPI00396A5AC7